MDSIWMETARMPRFKPLNEDLQTDVLIIGGGITGLLCAYFLEQAGVPYALVEAGRICGGTTGHTTGKITAQHGLVYGRLIRELGEEPARLYLGAQQAALARYRGLCQAIDCDFQERDAYAYSLHDRGKLEEEAAALARLGQPVELVGQTELPFPVAGAIRFPDQGQFHPLKFLAAIARGLHIYEGTRALAWQPGRVSTTGGEIRADRVVAATHFPFINNHGGYFLKLYQHRSYMLALSGAPEPKGMYVDENPAGMSFRSAGEFLLLGGGGHRTGKRGGGWRELEDFARRHYPQARVAGRWAAQDCISLDGAPYIGPCSRRTPELLVASGFNKWGMSGAMAAAELLTDLLAGRENPYTAVFAPRRSSLRPQLAANILHAAAGLLTPTAPRCPHLGCALKYNAQEHSWDCPCHGSRFTKEGKVLENPSNGNLKR